VTGDTDKKKDEGKLDKPDKPDPVDDLVITRHTLSTPSGELSYTARTGRVVLREEEVKEDVFQGLKARAELSVTAYTLDDGQVTERPITFVFNGGPGSSSIWLHMGLLGPRRVEVGDLAAPTPPPYTLVDNAETLLAVSDLVFIDPMSTGHSRAVEGGKAKDYHGFAKDVEQVTELIRLWCTREDRWMSPKYLIGESYGTVRAVAVAERLSTRHAMAFNGIVLVSSVLDFGSQDFEFLRADEACLNFLPTYAAIAHFHGLHPDRTLEEVRAEAEEFAAGSYRLALARGHRLAADERADVVATLARLTGLKEEYVDRTELRIEHWRWCTEVLRDRGLTVGRIDGRFTGPLHSRIAENMDADPSSDAIEAPFSAALHHYLRGELGSTLDLPYEVFANSIKEWSFKEFEGKPINVTDKLERLMRVNPHLRLRIEYGYYDLATPYHAAEDMVAHLRVPAEAFERIEHDYFETGHMPYLEEGSRVREAAAIAAFVTST
jgi:carboxypeptidase C (cathepsin A)